MQALLALALAAATPIDAQIVQVTVYGDRARVVRTAQVPLPGAAELRFPPLPQTVDVDSIRVEAEGAEVQRVEIADVTPEAFPVGPAKKLLAELEALNDQIARLQSEEQATRGALDALRSAAPSVNPTPPPAGERATLVRLDPGGWSAAETFVRTQTAALRTRLRDGNERLRGLREQRDQVAEKARLLGAAERPHGTQVTAFVSAARSGSARLTLSYEVAQASWRPLYDVQLDPARSEVRVALAGMVTQTTGEGWTNASLILSTALPATSRTFPEIPVWKIGERERFIPTPRPHPLPTAPPPNAPALEAKTGEGDALRDQLLSQVAADDERERDGDYAERKYARGAMARPMPEPMPMSPPPPPMPMEEAAPPAAAPAQAGFYDLAASEVTVRGSPKRREAPAMPLPLGPPAGYRPPTVASDTPAALAGGYDLVYPALRRETVPSGQGARRVALLSKSWPVTVTREVFPALAEAAFLVAELKNPSRDPLPGGHAELFVGDDPAGEAQLPLAAPGEKFTLPLGVDRALKPVRRVELVQAERGFISKDDVRDYKVVIELANPYPRDIDVHVVDQWPVTTDAHVKISLNQTDPVAQQEPVKGELDWRLTLPASSKRTLTYSYTVTCPRGWLLYQ